jgi:hypothetical protein
MAEETEDKKEAPADKKEMTAEESAFRNKAYETITGLMNENQRLKDAYGRMSKKNKTEKRSSGTIKGFKGFKGF